VDVTGEGEKSMSIQIGDITPELLAQIADQEEEERLYTLTVHQTRLLSIEWSAAVAVASDLEIRCHLRAQRLENFGVSRPEIARMFGVPTRTITRWLKSNKEKEA
jgi:DNA-binding transcriptional regulator YiaG